jgi:hypothetical protein
MRVTFMDITPIPAPRKHSIGMVSQSGALGMALAQAVVRGVSFSHVLTSGNSCDVATRAPTTISTPWGIKAHGCSTDSAACHRWTAIGLRK